MFPLVEDLAAEGVPVKLTCGLLGFSTQAFYKWKKRPRSDRDWADAHAINVILDVHADDPEFGYRLISDEFEQAGARTCERRVWRLCRQQRVWSTTTKKGRKHHGKTPGPAVHDDLVQRVFSAPAPDLVWLTDITEHPTLEGKLYCCSIKDCFSNRIVGYSIGDRMTADLAVSALRSAIARRQPHGTVVVTATEAVSSADESSEPRSRPTASPAPWAGSRPQPTTRSGTSKASSSWPSSRTTRHCAPPPPSGGRPVRLVEAPERRTTAGRADGQRRAAAGSGGQRRAAAGNYGHARYGSRRLRGARPPLQTTPGGRGRPTHRVVVS